MHEEFYVELGESLKKCRDILGSGADENIKALLRKKLIRMLSIPHEENWQCVETPYDIIGEMFDLVKCGEYFIVLFSMEMLEVLIKEKGIDKNKIIFIADNDAEAAIAGDENVYGVRCIVFNSKSEVNDKNFLSSVKTQIGEDFMKLGKVAVIGNPPYQLNDGGGNGSSAKPLYNLFVESIIDNIAPDYFSMIIPSRWMVGGKVPKDHLNRMMNDKRMKKIVHFPGDRDIFPTVSIEGGVNYFLWEKEYSGECEFVSGNTTTKRNLNIHDIILQDNNAFGILEKVMNKSNKWISEKCMSRNVFDIRSNFKDFKDSGTKCVIAGKKEVFVSDYSDTEGVIGKYKVCTSKANGAAQRDVGTGKRVIADAFVCEPGSICNETYLVVNCFDNLSEANNFVAYMKSKFFRFFLGLRVLTQNISKDKFNWVADMIDYSAVWTDKELYNHFDLTRQEIAYIESKIKAL